MANDHTFQTETVQRVEGHVVAYRSHRYECTLCGARLMSIMQFNVRECPGLPPETVIDRPEPAEPVTDQYRDGLQFAIDLVHAEARWQTELAMRANPAAGQQATAEKHRYAAERASKVEAALKSYADAVYPPAQQGGA